MPDQAGYGEGGLYGHAIPPCALIASAASAYPPAKALPAQADAKLEARMPYRPCSLDRCCEAPPLGIMRWCLLRGSLSQLWPLALQHGWCATLGDNKNVRATGL